MTVTLYKTNSPKKTVTKNLSDANQLNNCSFRKGDLPDDRDPVIVVNSSYTTVIQYNYVYIPSFSAYYFILDRRAVTNETTELILHKDVLMTFDASIRQHTALVRRQSSERQQYARDDMYKTIDKEIVFAEEFGNMNTISCDFILAVAGD